MCSGIERCFELGEEGGLHQVVRQSPNVLFLFLSKFTQVSESKIGGRGGGLQPPEPLFLCHWCEWGGVVWLVNILLPFS